MSSIIHNNNSCACNECLVLDLQVCGSMITPANSVTFPASACVRVRPAGAMTRSCFNHSMNFVTRLIHQPAKNEFSIKSTRSSHAEPRI